MAVFRIEPDKAETVAHTPVTIPVLANDQVVSDGGRPPVIGDLAGPPTVNVSPMHGTTFSDPADGQITYTPNLGFAGKDRFNYTLTSA